MNPIDMPGSLPLEVPGGLIAAAHHRSRSVGQGTLQRIGMMTTRHARTRRASLAIGTLAMFVVLCRAPAPAHAQVDTMTIDMGLFGGAPTYRASGFIYGLSQDASRPEQSLLSQIKVRLMRAGGSQIGCPNGGFVNAAYAARRDFVKAYYAKARAVGSKYSMLLSGLWGADRSEEHTSELQ